jgi:hypothetical protein
MTPGMRQIGVESEASTRSNAPDDGQHSQTAGNSLTQLARENGENEWVESGWQSKKRKSNKKNGSTQTTRLQQLEAEISNRASKTKSKNKKIDGRIQLIGQLLPRQIPNKTLTNLGRGRNQRLKRDGH